ncbi:PAS domain S-box protein [Algoriphagus winogradskyi]|uniref:PAS domain S-box-containing protein n=1 Tax=Algoriphagus winogradskyi TaxID=237017 RepID=A0ABY1NFF1_9BACT|nr:PAS domain S-box protein [Algoriphagus winogradskyi]SMP08272.1 PAS domain S-box-containing protein [Algoriphagus winogradskyi]
MSKDDLNIEVKKSHIDRTFPFHFAVLKSGTIGFFGSSFLKMMGDVKGKLFSDIFLIERPRDTKFEFDQLAKTQQKTFLLRTKSSNSTLFRGQFEYFEDNDILLFLGSPWFSSIEELVANDLSISDFAPLDPLVDLLHLIKNQELVTSDLKELLGTITQQKERLENLSYVASANADGIIFTDENGLITYVNKGYLDETGYQIDEVLGKTPIEIGIGDQTEKPEIHKMIDAFYNKEQFKIELKHYRKDGTWFWSRVNGQVVLDKKGNFLHFFTLLENVTEEKESKNKIKVFEDTFRQVLEFSGDNIWEHDFRTGKTSFSNQAKNFLGLKFDQNTNLEDVWYAHVYSEDLILLEENDKKYKNGEISSHQLEYRMLHEDGSIKWVKDRGIVIEKDKNGVPLKIIGTHSDITDQKDSEKELVNLNTKLGSVLNELRDVIWSVSYPNMNSIFFTPSAEDLFELHLDTMMNDKSWWEKSIHPEDKHVLSDIIKQVGINHEYVKEYRIVTTSQKVKWVQNKGKLIFEDGIPVRMNGILVDITERKKTEALIKSQEQLKNILIDISSTYINIDLEEVDMKINASLEKIGEFVNADRAYLFSYDLNALTCSCTHEWCAPGISQEIENTQNVPLEYVPQWFEVHSNGESFLVEDVSLLKEQGMDGLYDVLEPQGIKSLITIPMMIKDELLGFVGFDSVKKQHSYSKKEVELLFVFAQMLVNVQKRKQSEKRLFQQEEKFRNIISNMNLGLLEVDLEENVLHANQTFCKMADRKLEELVGKKATDLLLNPGDKERLLQKSESRKTGISDSYELKYKRPNGEYRWWFISGAPNYNDNNELIGSIGIHLDITDQKRLEEELIRQKEEAEKSKRAKEIFFANMSHEIRTPMNAIVGMGEQLAKISQNDQQTKYIKAIQNSASHLMVVIKDILDLSKLEAGKMTIESIGFKPKNIVDHVFAMMNDKAEMKGLDFAILNFDSRIKEVLIGDPIRISQILLNLLSNAVKFTEKGKVYITCDLISENNQKQEIKFTVVDTGIGMEESFIKSNFEKYVQEDTTITRKYGGTGLGLSISKELTQLMGGEMQIESEKGVGTKISVKLALLKGSSNDLPKDLPVSIDYGMLKGKKVLIVDDNEFNRLLASTILEQHDIITTSAVNGQDAVDLLREEVFDIVLMDVQMPIMDGIMATKIIREDLKLEVPIVALTAFAMKGDMEKYLSKGMNSFLAKPFKESELLHIVSQLLKGKPVQNYIGSLKVKEEKERYSLDELKAISKGNSEFMAKMIETFHTSILESVDQAVEAFEREDFDQVRKLAHKIKPSIKMLNIHEIIDEVVEVELEVMSQKRSERMVYLMGHIDQVLKWVAKDMKSINNEK